MPDLTGFTLFRVTKGWQMSTRTVSENGWEVQTTPDATASEILDLVDAYLRKTRSIAAYRETEPRPRSPSDPLGLRRVRRRVTLD